MIIYRTDKNRIYIMPDQGCWLTNNILYSAGPVYLGKFDTPENWSDIETPDNYEWRQIDNEKWELISIEEQNEEINNQ